MKSFVQPSGGIDWYCEQRGAGPDLVLVPSGEGDCANYARTAEALADQFTVLTFDTPGFSRSSRPADPEEMSAYRLGRQIAELVRSLEIDQVTFYGCSSGGVAVLDILTGHRDLVRNAIVHEAAIIDLTDLGDEPPELLKLIALDDAGVVAACQHFFATVFNEDQAAWEAVGADYHKRLEKNYITWVRDYIAKTDLTRKFDPASLRNQPLAWTVGGLSATERTIGNIRLAHRAGIDMRLLPCLHFPQVSIPDKLADHIRCVSAAYL